MNLQTVETVKLDKIDVPITERGDLVSLRQVVRGMAQQLHGTLRDQARVSWVANQLARQMLDMSKGGDLSLEPLQESARTGIRVSCEGPWLRLVERTYRFHISPMISRNDEVEYESGRSPRLMITMWMGAE